MHGSKERKCRHHHGGIGSVRLCYEWKKSASKFQVANFGFFSWVVFPPKSRVATFGLLLLGSPTKNLTIVVTVTCQGDNPRYKGKHIPHHYQGAPHGRCRWKVGGVFLDIHLAAFGMVLKWLAFLVARNTWFFCAFFFLIYIFRILMDEIFQRHPISAMLELDGVGMLG